MWPYFHPNRASYNLGRKNVVSNNYEFSALKPFKHICQKFHPRF